jgi:colicin import membrane protein
MTVGGGGLMAEQRESSMLFSLRGLMDVEQQRIDLEADARRRALEEIRMAREEDALRERARRERSDHVERIRLGVIERARLQAEATARLELVEQRHAHERQLSALRDELRRRRERQLTLASLLFAVASSAAGVGLYFGKVRPEAERLQIAYDELVLAERARAVESKRLLGRTQQKLEAAEQRIHELERAGSRQR